MWMAWSGWMASPEIRSDWLRALELDGRLVGLHASGAARGRARRGRRERDGRASSLPACRDARASPGRRLATGPRDREQPPPRFADFPARDEAPAQRELDPSRRESPHAAEVVPATNR